MTTKPSRANLNRGAEIRHPFWCQHPADERFCPPKVTTEGKETLQPWSLNRWRGDVSKVASRQRTSRLVVNVVQPVMWCCSAYQSHKELVTMLSNLAAVMASGTALFLFSFLFLSSFSVRNVDRSSPEETELSDHGRLDAGAEMWCWGTEGTKGSWYVDWGSEARCLRLSCLTGPVFGSTDDTSLLYRQHSLKAGEAVCDWPMGGRRAVPVWHTLSSCVVSTEAPEQTSSSRAVWEGEKSPIRAVWTECRAELSSIGRHRLQDPLSPPDPPTDNFYNVYRQKLLLNHWCWYNAALNRIICCALLQM